mmetsp:Transcript_4252/g.10205  ORF Transcript_4252/g.10205 Transcript_4252/m.10205 type:complete len:196 (-) Transcript_4252:208-795(-)
MQKLCYALLLLKAATALQLALPGLRGAAPGTMRSVRVVAEEEEMDMSDVGLDMLLETMDAAEEAAGPCWMVELKHMSDAGCSSVQKVLKQAQKQGNWLRGLEGTVLVESEDTLQILAQGAPDKLDSFADWCKSELEGADVVVNSVDKEKVEYCSLLPLTKSFGLAGSGSAFEAWQDKLKFEPGDEVAGWSEEAQF